MTTTYVVPRGALLPLPPVPSHVELDLERDADEWDALMPHQAGLLRAVEEETPTGETNEQERTVAK